MSSFRRYVQLKIFKWADFDKFLHRFFQNLAVLYPKAIADLCALSERPIKRLQNAIEIVQPNTSYEPLKLANDYRMAGKCSLGFIFVIFVTESPKTKTHENLDSRLL